MNQTHIIFEPKMPTPRVFTTNGAVKVTVSGLIGSDSVSFLLVQESASRAGFMSGGCFVAEPTSAEIATATPYTVGECQPVATTKRQAIFIADAGKYLPVIHGDESDGGLTIFIEEIPSRDFLAEELGIVPCRGCAVFHSNLI